MIGAVAYSHLRILLVAKRSLCHTELACNFAKLPKQCGEDVRLFCLLVIWRTALNDVWIRLRHLTFRKQPAMYGRAEKEQPKEQPSVRSCPRHSENQIFFLPCFTPSQSSGADSYMGAAAS